MSDFGGSGVVSDHQKRHVELFVQSFEQIENLIRSDRVQVAGRLVSDDDFRMSNDGSCDAGSLLLTARHLTWVVVGPVKQIDGLQCDLNTFSTFAGRHRQQQQRQFDVLIGGENGDEIMGLEDVAHAGCPPVGQLCTRQIRNVDSVDHDAAAVRLVDAGDQVQQRGLSGAAGSHQRNELALFNVHRHGVQRRNRLAAFVELFRHIPDLNQCHIGCLLTAVDSSSLTDCPLFFRMTGLRQRPEFDLPREVRLVLS